MGNCMFTGIGNEVQEVQHGQIWKMWGGGGRLCMKGCNVFEAPNPNSNSKRPCWHCQAKRHGNENLKLNNVDVTQGLDLQLENSVAPCRLSSGTAADLLAKIGTNNASDCCSCRTPKTVAKPSLEVLPSHQKGVWKVKLVITAEQLAEILSHQSNTEALIERMSLTAAQSKDHSLKLKPPSASTNAEKDQPIGCLSRNGYCPWRPSLDSSWRPSLDSISEDPAFDTPNPNSSSFGEETFSTSAEFVELDLTKESRSRKKVIPVQA